MRYAAIDLGASSGRVILGSLEDGSVSLEDVARFNNEIVPLPGETDSAMYWDLIGLWKHIRAALAGLDSVDSIGIDTWAVDYGLLDRDGFLAGLPRSYRDPRTQGIPETFFNVCPAESLYRMNGLQRQDFNTMFQLLAEHQSKSGLVEQSAHLLLLPDLLGYWLTGHMVSEVTNSSSTGLIDPRTRTWSNEVMSELSVAGVDVKPLLVDLVEPGTQIGSVRQGLGLPAATVTAVATHDTASAVAAVPATSRNFAYISCGTWSLVGTELDFPVTSTAAQGANFTNELGIDGTVRFLKNIMGLWVFNEFVKELRADGENASYADLNEGALRAEPLRTVININDERLFAPGPMRERISHIAHESGEPIPRTPYEFYRCILDSLALSYRAAIEQTQALTGRPLEEIHIVGGGINNTLLCQLTADAIGKPVIAGPAECTALGNVLVQAQAMGEIPAGRDALRAVSRNSVDITTYNPQSDIRVWDDAVARLERR